MASIIKIKRSPNAGIPSVLGQGELAYSYGSGTLTNNGDRLFIGTGIESGGGDAATKSAIGGLYYTRLIDASSPGLLTTNANSVPVLSSTGTIDKWYAGNTYIHDNIISTTNTNGNLSLNPNGTGMVKIADTWTLPRSAGTNNYILKTNGSDTATWAEPKIYIGSTAIDLFNGTGTTSSLAVDISGKATTAGTADQVAHSLTAGNGISFSSGTTYDGSAAITIASNDTLAYVVGRGNTTTTGITVGSLSIGSSYTLPTVDGTGGYILKTWGNGVVYWSSATAAQIQADWTQTDSGQVDYIKNKPMLATVATSGSYNDLSNTPMLATVATSGSYNDLSNTPMLATVATSGSYNDLSNTPMLATVATSGSYTDLSNTPMLATVATSGSYNDLSNTPMLAAVATSGSYNDLINKPDTAAYLNLQADSGTANVSLITDTIDFVGTTGINTAVVKVGSTVSVTTSLSAGGITNASLANSNVTIGSTTVNLGSTVTAFAGLTSFQVGNIKIYSANQIVSTENNGNINLVPNGGTVDVNNTRITSVANPSYSTDAANKYYVDTVASGMHIHIPAAVATTANLAVLTGGTVTYNNGTSGVGATLTLSVAVSTIDDQSFGSDFTSGDRILVKDESTAINNGIYTISANGKVLTRATDFNTPVLVHGGDFVFVQYGTKYGATGWVQTQDTDAIGSSDIIFSQFAGPGTYTNGAGLNLDGTRFSANVNSTTGGIEIVSNQIQLKATIAGNGLTYTSGVVNIGGTNNRIDVSADAIDISSNYVGQSSITTLGTITTGTWNGVTIGTGYGGTGLTTYNAYDLLIGKLDGTLQTLGLGSGGQILQVNSAGTALVYADLDGGVY